MKPILALTTFLFLSITSFEQCALTWSVDSIPANCAGSCDGSIVISFANSGTPAAPFVAVFQNSFGVQIGSHTFYAESGNYTFPGVCAGLHTVSIQSISGLPCFEQTTIVVTEPSPVLITSVDVTHENTGMSNGEITVNASGGIPPYVYSINGGATYQSSNLFTGIEAGSYDVIVQDANGCTVEQIVGVGLIVSSGCEVVATAIPTATPCFGLCEGEIQFDYQNLQMGNPGSPYQITIEDSDGIIIDSQIHATESQSILFFGLCADTYTITAQGTTCSFIIDATVGSPDPMVINTNLTPPTFGDSNGEADVFVTGGLSPYLYSIDGSTSFQASPNFFGLSEGNYQGSVIDANGCEQPFEFDLTDYTVCDVQLTASALTSATCYESCDGSLSYQYTDIYSNGTYTISLIHNGISVQTASHNSSIGNGVFENVCAGNYTIEVSNNLGCLANAVVSVSEPAPVQITTVNTTNADPGLSNGTATINATGGQTPYTFSMDGSLFVGSSLFTDLSKGVHVAYVEDANGCATEFMFVIQKNSSCDFNILIDTDSVSCTGSCDGSFTYTFNGSGSDTPFSIVLEKNGDVIETAVDPATNVNGSFTDLCPGNYILTVGNSSGCEQLAIAAIQQPSAFSVSASTGTASTGINDGEIFVYVDGGTAPYQFSIDDQNNWQSSSVFNSVNAGTYTVWAEDGNGCQAMFMTEVQDTSSCSFILNLTTSETTCAGNCNADLYCTFIDTDNNPPFVIQLYYEGNLIDTSAQINDFSGLFEASDLCAGSYTIAVIDADGCTDAQNIYIHGPEMIQVTDVVVTDATAGNSDGSVILTVTGGTAPYEYTITDGITWQNENSFHNLDSGSYVAMIKDANDCFYIHTFAVNEQPGCIINTTFVLSSEITCYDSCDAVIDYSYFEAVNTPPYVVKLMANSGVIESDTYMSNSFSGFWDTLCQGFYSISVTNGNGCMAFMPSVTITKPDDLFLDGIITDSQNGASDGSIELFVTGGTGLHQFSLDAVSYQTTPIYENLAPGNYLANVLDENNCHDTLHFVISEDFSCDIQLSTIADAMLTCTGDCNGSISFDYNDANNNPPYAIQLFNNSGSLIGSEIGTNANGIGLFTNLCAGTYSVVVTDASGCQSDPEIVTINQPPYLVIDTDLVQPTEDYYNGSITLNPSGGTPPYQFSTNNQVSWTTTNSWSTLNAGFYIIYVQDANGCIQVICIVLSDPALSSVVEVSASVSVYPNPTQGMVFVEATNLQSVVAFDLNGNRINVHQLDASNGTAIDFSEIASGMYILEITTNDGVVMHSQVIKN